MLFVTKDFESPAFDEYHNHKVVKDVWNEKGANECKKDVSIGQSKANALSSLGLSPNPLVWYDESHASRGSDVSNTSRWLEQFLGSFCKHLMKLCSLPSGCGDPGYTFQETQGNVSQVNSFEQMLYLLIKAV